MAGRGRGRGGGGQLGPTARDDDGNVLEAASPPKLFPDVMLPDRPGDDRRITELRAQQKKLNDFWRGSVYRVSTGNTADDMPSYAKVERWQDRQAGSTKTGTLQQAMTLDPTYFPEELYSAKDKRTSAKAASRQAQLAFWAASARASTDAAEDRATKILSMLDRQEELGSVASEVSSPTAKAPAEDGEEKEEEDDNEDEQADDDDVEEDDDYLQGEQVDDDEGYDDPYGDDDGADQAYM